MKNLFFLIMFSLSQYCLAKINVVTTVTDLAVITKEIGLDQVEVNSIAKGTQDPHFIEAKPSFMTKLNHADLVISIGLDLEIGWLPTLLQGARNPKIIKGSSGYLEVGPLVEPLEIPVSSVSRADGDVHPYGNPHVTLDPLRAGQIAIFIAEKLAELDSAHKADFLSKANSLKLRLEDKSKNWGKRIKDSKIAQVITYHKTLTYFLDRFQIKNPAILEPKPGIPPTSTHIMSVIDLAKKEKINLILVENFFDPTVTRKIQNEIPSIRVETVPVYVEGAPGILAIDDLYEYLVKAIEGK